MRTPFWLLQITLLSILCMSNGASGQHTRKYQFHVKYKSFTRLCSTKTIPTVNGRFPGPNVFATEGDHMLITIKNELPDKNVTIHWHGIKQIRNGWADGPGYVTQCPMKPGTSYTYNFNITGQRGTLWWHAHLTWMRATIYGAIIILPNHGSFYPFPTPSQEIPLLLGEWWKASVDSVTNQAKQNGGALNVSDAFTINGQPGALYPCSSKGTTVISVESGKTYLLRIVNAAVDAELFVGVAGHKLTVVEVDATYTKPLQVDHVLITPGQTMNVLLTADQTPGSYYLAARPYIAPTVVLDNTTTTAIIAYEGAPAGSNAPVLPSLPALNDTSSAASFSTSLRSLASSQFPAQVPLHVDRHLFFTVGLAILPCPSCAPSANGSKLAGVINNISFVLPSVALLQAHYFKTANVFTTNFPDKPINSFNFTGNPPTNFVADSGTRLNHIPFNSTVELVLQDTSIIAPENHPIHLHGYNFFVVGQGFGNYDNNYDPLNFNLIDPQERNTIGVPQGGWVALRFRADNPGVWFMHCHLELHSIVGLEMAFVVDNGPSPEQSIIPPPHDLPPC
eukprot:c21997_g1_i1 orf=271-1962(+)